MHLRASIGIGAMLILIVGGPARNPLAASSTAHPSAKENVGDAGGGRAGGGGVSRIHDGQDSKRRCGGGGLPTLKLRKGSIESRHFCGWGRDSDLSV